MKKEKRKYFAANNMLYLLKTTAEYLPSLIIWVILSIIVKVSIPILEMYIPKIVINEILNGDRWQSLIMIVFAITVSLAILAAFAKYCERTIYHKKNLIGLFYIRKIANKVLTTDYANRETDSFRTLQEESYQMCQSNESVLRNVYYGWIDFFKSVIGFSIYAAILTQLHIYILLFLATTSVISYFLGLKIAKWAIENNPERTRYHHKLGYIDEAAEDMKSAKDIRLYHMECWLERIYSDTIEQIAKWYKRYDQLVIKIVFFNSSISLLREGVAYAYLIYLAMNGTIGVGDFVLYFAAITGFSAWLQAIISGLTEMKRTSMYVEKYRNFLDYPEKFKREGGLSTNGKRTHPSKIELLHVSYQYLGADEYTLKDINVTIHANEHLGIVGLNGAGKTTLVKLICGLVDPTSGEILYDGINVKEYNRTEYYNLFSAVFQQYSLLALTLEEVVSETTLDKIDPSRVEECLKLAGLWSKIESLPNGPKSYYDKSVHENGVAFSGGEIQKLLLARALYQNAPVLLLDEPTAALDPIAENKLYENYHSITINKTSIFISHRLASTRFCDRILLINHGTIEEMGTHTELLKNRRDYFTLFETQAKYYREHSESEVLSNEE